IALLEEQRFFEERPSYFELLTAAGYAWFSEVAVDVAVVEVGLLGRYDATNVADGQVAVVTNVARDHTDGRGDWRRDVAGEKAGIVKPGSHLVLGEPDAGLRDVFTAEGPEALWVRGDDFGVVRDRLALGGHLLDLRTPLARHDEVFLPVHGAHQADNAAAAVAAVEAFFGRPLDDDVVAEAFARLRLPGRLEVLHRAPLLVLADLGTGWRWAGTCSTCGPRWPGTTRCSCRSTVPTRPTTPPPRWRRSRRSSAAPSTTTSWPRRSPGCGSPGASRSCTGRRSSSST